MRGLSSHQKLHRVRDKFHSSSSNVEVVATLMKVIVGSGSAQVKHSWASIAILSELTAFSAIECIAFACSSANYAFSFKHAKTAFITDFDLLFGVYE